MDVSRGNCINCIICAKRKKEFELEIIVFIFSRNTYSWHVHGSHDKNNSRELINWTNCY